MEAKELRIGNWIRHKYSEPDFIVSEINAFSENNTVNGIDLCDCEPISITEEWLIDFGFVKDNNENYLIGMQVHYLELMTSNGYWYPTYAQAPEMSHENEQRVSTNRIKYVHQLQNLYFALTGEELELKTKNL